LLACSNALLRACDAQDARANKAPTAIVVSRTQACATMQLLAPNLLSTSRGHAPGRQVHSVLTKWDKTVVAAAHLDITQRCHKQAMQQQPLQVTCSFLATQTGAKLHGAREFGSNRTHLMKCHHSTRPRSWWLNNNHCLALEWSSSAQSFTEPTCTHAGYCFAKAWKGRSKRNALIPLITLVALLSFAAVVTSRCPHCVHFRHLPRCPHLSTL
jgi:hypothetical protein